MKYFLCMIGLIISAGVGAMEDAPLPLDHPDAAVPAFSKPPPLKKSSTLGKKEKRKQEAGKPNAQQPKHSKIVKKPLKTRLILHKTGHNPSKMLLKQGRHRQK